ncbi:MAG: polyprenyl synthetase family protein [Chloroflexi bacterium]|nr:polyprenyl synthetase family protein [Chloroflexota bacterium]
MVIQERTQLIAEPMSQADTQQLAQTIDEALKAVDTTMYDAVDSKVTVLRDASRHILGAGGKRVRPRMMLLSYAALGGTNFDAVLPVAAAVELVHTASVVHDDINDHGVMRRGRPSVNAIWGRTFALLTGDYLFTQVYELMAPYGSEMNTILAAGTTALVEGETLQAAAVKDNNLSREIYFEIIGLKTAALFRSAAMLGSRLAGATDPVAEAFGQYGYNVGLAFQIIDDILDLIGDAEQLGKTSGIDVEQGRGIAVAYTAGNTPDNAGSSDPMVAIKQKLLQGDAIDTGRAQARQLVEMAIDALDVLPESAAKDELIALAYQVVDRDR